MPQMEVLSDNNRVTAEKVQKRILLIERLTHLAAHSSRRARPSRDILLNGQLKDY